ncbi:hypothetical protein A8135_09390 [Legionella jamestowniensis]|uniref:Beta-lactamase n=1 Tax=Legionella jamestowniensis TaxID=455 RepID=A0ABX2XWM9_9GAMM|nr:serine hydrolase [Legionella jamestowniensis]OCH98961.1 hypothetical protein A8135_09390 [Legionella jamestowniensis]
MSLLQLMTHYGGLGDYGGTYRERLEEGATPQIMEVKDFLQFAEQTAYPVGKWHYSNLGITLVSLAIEHAYNNYQKTHPSLTLPPLNFFGILKKYVLDNVQISNFFVKAPVGSSYRVKVNQEDKAALAWIGGHAGGYWTSTSELVKFGQWLYEKYKDPLFKELITKYGEGFIKDGKIMHPGLSTFSSAFFFFDLVTGKTGAVAATHKSALSIGLELALGDRMFIDNKEAKNTINVTTEQQEQNPDSSFLSKA